MLFLGIAAYLLVFLLSPLDVLVPIEFGSFVYIGLTVAALVLGSRLADHLRLGAGVRHIPATQLKRAENRLFWAMLWVGGIGNLVRLFDKYILRGVGDLTGLAAREAMIDSGVGPLSLIGAVLYPVGYIPIFILLGAKVLPRKRWKLLLAGFVFLIPALDAMLLFSRSFLLVALAMAYFGLSLTLYKGRVVPLKLILPILAGVGLVLTISIVIFNSRLGEMNLILSDSVFLSGYAYTVSPNATAQDIINRGGLLASLIPIAQYYVHSIPEFQILWNMQETQDFSGGALLFSPYYKLLAILGVTSEPDLFELFPRVGIFTSFWGPFWVDFGWFGPIVMFVMGIMMRNVARTARAGDLRAYPLYSYLCVVLFFMPVANFLISAQGMYVITAFVIFWFWAKKTSRTVPI